ncbi:MAG: phage tail fiber protein, partial [Planctomycetota bacterium]
AAASGGSKATSGAIVFTGLPATTINGYVIWDASSGGNALYTSHALGSGIVVAANDELEFASGDITVTLD